MMATSCYVRENADGSIYYPPTLPKPRNYISSFRNYADCALFFAVGFFMTEKDVIPLLHLVSIFLSTVFFFEIINIIDLVLMEKEHLRSRYQNDYKVLLSDVLRIKKMTILFIAFVVCLYFLYQNSFILQSYSIPCIMLSFMFTYCLCTNLHAELSSLDYTLLIESLNGMDYGSGMAYSFFHGYLKLVLLIGETGKSFKDLISMYEDNHNVEIRVKKLFILIPLSAKCPATLDDPDLGIEESSSLPQKIMTVAGVKNRVYKNSVYKILQEGEQKKVYVCLEYATPLKTFYDVFNSKSRFSETYRKYRQEVVLHFYTTLKMILEENPECNNLCELVYYDDKFPNGKYHTDIGNIILNRINEISRNN